MTLAELVSKYISSTQRAFDEVKHVSRSIHINERKIEHVIGTAKRYLEDAEYYQRRNRLETSLASVAYCEGLLDALRLLGAVKFSW